MATQKNPGYVRDIVTGVVRIAFPHLMEPNTEGQYHSDKYEVHALYPKSDTATHNTLNAAALKAAQEVWPGITLAELIVGMRDGDEKANLDGFPGNWFLCAKSKNPVPVYGPAREKLSPDSVYSGCFARVMVTAGAYKRNVEPIIAQDLLRGGRKLIQTRDEVTGQLKYAMPAVTFYLNAVQFVKGGDRLGAGSANPDAFPMDAPEAGSTPFSAPAATGSQNANPWG